MKNESSFIHSCMAMKKTIQFPGILPNSKIQSGSQTVMKSRLGSNERHVLAVSGCVLYKQLW